MQRSLRAIKAASNNYAAAQFAKLKNETAINQWVSKGAYDQIINDAKIKFDLPEDEDIKKDTI